MSISLEASLRTCKVDSGWANKSQSDRFLNPNNMVCPVWNGRDITGRQVSPDSFMTKRAGCNNASDRVVVENNVSRPQYMEYINLNAAGVDGDIYGNSISQSNMKSAAAGKAFAEGMTGQFGMVTGKQNIQSQCSVDLQSGEFLSNYDRAMAQMADDRRGVQAVNNKYYSNNSRSCGGN